jgi:hypothetical protein
MGGFTPAPRKPGDFVRDADGSPRIAHLTKRNKNGKPTMVKASRPSGYGDQLENGYALKKWEERGIALGVARTNGVNGPALTRLLDADDATAERLADSLIARWKGAADLKRSADIGTWVHSVIAGGPVDMAEADRLGLHPEMVDIIRSEWAAFLNHWDLTVLAQELPVVSDRWGCAGTSDAYVRSDNDVVGAGIFAGDVVVLDVKTGKLTTGNDGTPDWWLTYPVQLAIYADGVLYNADAQAAGLPPTDFDNPYRKPLPWDVRKDIGLIAHFDAAAMIAGQRRDLMALVPVDLTVGAAGADLVANLRAWSKLAGCLPVLRPTQDAEQVTADPLPLLSAEPTTVAVPPAAAVVKDTPTPQEQFAAMPSGPPSEGDDLNGDGYAGQWTALIAEAGRLKAADLTAHATWLGWREQAVHAGVDYHSGSGKRSVRRFEILRGTLMLAGVGVCGWSDDDMVKSLVVSVTDNHAVLWPVITAGHALGSLDHVQAAAFAELVDHAINGAVDLEHHDDHIRFTAI